ncbi:hypothetical protein [Humibacillus sp. DSM 29435]|uniref:hypothetical protein n=1 Tax=Humibacillus sp. DSM 29435 TaxID=1869167 RepID=UPI0011131C01|nr:hypothetical protein [Humibacillus sp. DSM 29435]
MPWSKPDPDDPPRKNQPNYERRRVSIPGPASFTNADARRLIEETNFATSFYVNTSAKKEETRQAYAYVTFEDWRLCVVGHIHVKEGKFTLPGKSFIPGWAGWSLKTPPGQCAVIDGLDDHGDFPEDDRYPTKD